MFGVDKKMLERLRREFPEGTRIQLTADLDDRYAPIPVGTQGTVTCVDDAGQVHVSFDGGHNLGLIYGVDSYRKAE